MPLHPGVYAGILGEKINRHNVSCWLVNTGWTGGSYGDGKRMSIKYTRALLNAALDGKLNTVSYKEDPVFGLSVPVECSGVPSEILTPKNTWKNKKAYDQKAAELAGRFKENFKKYEAHVSPDVTASGPK